jgi:predicted alpha/beta-fold hydrolase
MPFAVLQALDDPLVGWRTVGTNDPQGLADSGSGNVMLLLTKAGGHVVSFFETVVIILLHFHFF